MNFEFAMPEGAGLVEIGVFDVSGRRLAVLFRGSAARGCHRIGVDGGVLGRFSPGVYVIRAEAATFRRTLRVVVL